MRPIKQAHNMIDYVTIGVVITIVCALVIFIYGDLE